MRDLEVCFSPVLFKKNPQKARSIVVIDVLRASSAICAAFDAGVKAVIPVRNLKSARKLKRDGYLTAAERNGIKPSFADFGNSPAGFNPALVRNNVLAYTTTNGTRALMLAAGTGETIIGTFNNGSAVVGWLSKGESDVLLLCAGWKNCVSLEDTMCAGYFAELLIAQGIYKGSSDSVTAALLIWTTLKHNLTQAVSNSEHGIRLKKLGLQSEIDYCLKSDISDALPYWDGQKLINKNH